MPETKILGWENPAMIAGRIAEVNFSHHGETELETKLSVGRRLFLDLGDPGPARRMVLALAVGHCPDILLENYPCDQMPHLVLHDFPDVFFSLPVWRDCIASIPLSAFPRNAHAID